MDSFETSMGVPGARIVESVHDRNQSNQYRKKEGKKKKSKKANKTEARDSVTLSVTSQTDDQSTENTTEKPIPRGKGDFIDIQV